MLALRWLLMAAGVAMFGTAAGVVAYDVYLATQFQKLMGSGQPGAAEEAGTSRPIRWSLATQLFGFEFNVGLNLFGEVLGSALVFEHAHASSDCGP